MLNAPTNVDSGSNAPHLFEAPAERSDVVVDFSGQAGQRFILTNTAVAPFPNGGAVVESLPPPALQGPSQSNPNGLGPYETVDQVMEFRVDLPLQGTDTSFNPAGNHPALRATPIVDIKPGDTNLPVDAHRQLVLDEVEDINTGAPVEVILNNSHWNGLREGSTTTLPGSVSNGHGLEATEAPREGATELWEIANMTPDAHPIHIHLIQFQVINVQPFNTEADLCPYTGQGNFDFSGPQYRAQWDSLFPGGTFNGFTFPAGTFIPGYGPPSNYTATNADGAIGGNLAFGTGHNQYFVGPAVPPDPRDSGWKSTRATCSSCRRRGREFPPTSRPISSSSRIARSESSGRCPACSARWGARIPRPIRRPTRWRVLRSEHGELVAYLYVDLDPATDLADYVSRAQREVDRSVAGGRLHLGPGERIGWTGQYELMMAGEKRLQWVAPAVIVTMLALLLLQFRSLTEAFIVLVSVPFALVGSIWTLFVLGYPLSAPVWVGLLSVVGLAMQTGVVMVVYIDEAFHQRLREGRIRSRADIVAAHAEGTIRRLRPKMMTVGTMAASLLPLLWADGAGAEIIKRVAAPMLGGLVTSVLLTLEVLPVIYTLWRSAQLRRAQRTGKPIEVVVGAAPGWAGSPSRPFARIGISPLEE